ncbi:YolD-like family protein [Bacillus sp. L381]|uniref:YolD-like family protein n=1 Tax=Bacillus TaxID=1386 RepID=UPI001BA5909E|nr:MULTISPECIES: YolD-like family protein [Bacillus]MCR9040970.1 YolD-like family protein [Bacillus velezensis]MEC3841586.1 YolD-like family protein [Bacillus amyloliquefaciens]QUN07948.1 YolD-like family protein [Bacillus amyloliquefaciens]QYM81014.1 YolD-like family protein [Bacillus sp. 7D3]QZY10161.1 YolD-like family protein [Bacillus amyloliquefaciens]
MINDKSIWSSKFILPELREGFQRLEAEKHKIQKPLLDAQCIEEMEITVAQSMETGAPLLFEVYDNGYIHEITGSVHYVDHVRKEFRVKNSRSETNLVQFQSIISVKNTPSV